jgi:hypothetical protein
MEDRYGWDKEFMAVGIVLVLLLVTFGLAHADDATGLPQGDPKDMSSEQAGAPAPCLTGDFFLPIPTWSHFTKMPPLPEQLTPMGHSLTIAKPAPAAVAETKPDAAPMPKPAVKPKPAAPDPALMAVSPFLQWVKDHPDEAASQARKQAETYTAGPPAVTAPTINPYWMPPMIDDSGTPPPVTGSAAIYSRPQR